LCAKSKNALAQIDFGAVIDAHEVSAPVEKLSSQNQRRT
jgi:hypothetical protein